MFFSRLMLRAVGFFGAVSILVTGAFQLAMPVLPLQGDVLLFISNDLNKHEVRWQQAIVMMDLERWWYYVLVDQVPGVNGLSWSPDGEHIAFENYIDGNREIFIMDHSGANITNLTAHPAQDTGATWSPDGREIIFSKEPVIDDFRMTRAQLHRVGIHGSNLHYLNVGRGIYADPAWSPDGSQVAFVMRLDAMASSDLFVMNPDGSDIRALTTTRGVDETGPAWSPDGTRIAFVRRQENGSQIFIINADGTGLTRLTDEGRNLSPAWSPDGTRIAFTSDRGGGGMDIYVMDANGENLRRITYTLGMDVEPVWGPRR